MIDERPTFGSLFAGIGGIDLGLERAGWRGRWQVEYEPFCQRVLARHWPDVTRYGDIRDVDWSGVESVDLVAGGFPCQPFSVAGKQRGMDDDRWLWPEFERCLRALRPRYVLVENVPGLLVGRGMDAVLGGLADLGYDTEWECIPAAAVGAPHLRYRVWIIAHSNGLGRQGERSSGLLDGIGAAFGDDADGRGHALADAASLRPSRPREPLEPVDSAASRDGQASEPRDAGWWSVEPDVRGVAHGVPQGLDGHWASEWEGVPRVASGVPDRVNRLRALGNAVVPQVVELIGRRLLDFASD